MGELIRELVRELFGPMRRGRAILVSVCAPVAAFVCWSFGADVSHAIVIGACLAAVGFAWAAWPGDERRPVQWQRNIEPREGGRWDVARLSWSLRFYRRGQIGLEALRRVQELGRTRLAARRLDPDKPGDTAAIEALIGGGALAVLRGSGARTPTMRALVHYLDALDALEPADAHAARHVTTPSRLRAMLHRLGRRPALTSLRRSPRRAR